MQSRFLLFFALAASLRWLAASPAVAGPFTANGTQPGLAHPIQSSANCTGCHGNYDASHNIEPGPTWEGSLMGQAGRDPIFWAALDVANHDAPGVGDFCLRCHAVSAWLAGRSEPPLGSVDGCALSGHIDQQNTDFDGVTCLTCHRMQPNASPPLGQQSIYLDNGQFWLDDGTCGGQGEPCRFGPYDYSNGGFLAAPHVWSFSSYLTSSDMCGNCHNVTSPALNLIVSGIDAGIRFPIERTHREWEQSAFALPGSDFQTCQDCHMPNATNNPAYASSFLLNNHTGNMGIHAFAGGNAWIPEVLRAEYPALGIDASLAANADFARAMLASAAEVSVDLPAAAHPGGNLTAQVSVTNLSGHKLPTGYPEGRRMWLHVEARDTTGTLIFESGAYDAATGVLTRDAQVKVYESKQGVWNAGTNECETEVAGEDQFHFVLNNCVELDNRIPPKGFTGGADLETHPVGYTYPEVAPGILSNTDMTTYTIPVPANATMPVTVTATLRYQTTSKEYVEFLRDEAVDHAFPNDCITRSTGPVGTTRGGVLHDMWTTHGRAAPVTMASAAATAAFDPFLCAKTKISKGTPKPAQVLGVALTDAFGSGTVDAKVLGNLCAPAAVGTGVSVLDAGIYLTAFKLKGTAGVPQTGLHLTDRFGSLTVDTKKPVMLLIPTALGTVLPARPSHSVDDFTCYKAAISKNTPKLAKGLQAEVASAFGPTRTVDLKSLYLVCVATDRGAGIKNADARLACYKAKPAKGHPTMTPSTTQAIASDLATATVDAVGDSLVCVPATTTP
jgi:hypothetical protein